MIYLAWLAAIFAALKVFGAITWPWIYVFLPALIPCALAVLAAVLIGIFTGFCLLLEGWRFKSDGSRR